jgi:hypothetical protein
MQNKSHYKVNESINDNVDDFVQKLHDIQKGLLNKIESSDSDNDDIFSDTSSTYNDFDNENNIKKDFKKNTTSNTK